MARSIRPLGSRLIWFGGLWLAGVLAVTIVGYGIKLALGH